MALGFNRHSDHRIPSGNILVIEFQLALYRHPPTKNFELPSRQFEGNRLAVFPAVDRGKLTPSS